MSVEENVSEFFEQTAEAITDKDDENEDEEPDTRIAHTSRNEVDKAIKTLKQLTLFTKDSGFDPLISKLTRIINQVSRDKMWKFL